MARAEPLLMLMLTTMMMMSAVAAYDAPCPRTPGPQSGAARLKQQLLQHYVADEPPPTQGGQPLPVRHAILLKHVPGIYSNVAEIQIAIALTWEDSRLFWDPAKYDNLWNILVDSSNVWVPFLGIQSHPTTAPDWVDLAEQTCVLGHDGSVTCLAAATVSAHCASDYRTWPQDLHNCSFHIGSWMLTSEHLYLKDFHLAFAMAPDGPWLERQHGFSTTNDSVGPDGRMRSVSTVWLLLAHQQAAMDVAAYSAAVGLAVLTLSSLVLPSACGERQALGATSVLAHCLVLGYFSWWLEGGARAPRIVVFHRDGLCAACAALLLVVWTGRLQASRRAAPGWLQTFVGRLRGSAAGALLLPPPAKQSEVPLTLMWCGVPQLEAPPADAPATASAEPPGGDARNDADDAGSDALVAPASASTTRSTDAEVWVAASVLVERLGRGGVFAAMLAALLRLLLGA